MKERSYYLKHWPNWPMPVMSIPDILNPFKDDGVDISSVLMNHLPYENLKFLTVFGLLIGAEKSGKLHGVHTLVEATSGNTGIALATMAKSFGIQRVKLVVAPDLPDGKRYPLLMTGAELIPPEEGMSAIATARKLGDQHGWLNLDQYANIDGTKLHENFTAQNILFHVSQPPTVFVAGIGTGGSLIGTAKGLRNTLEEEICIVGVLLSSGQEIPGVRDLNRMKEISLPWKKSLDFCVEAKTKPSYLAALWFNWVMGITPGPSSGFAYLGALRFLQQRKLTGFLDSLRGKNGRIHCVVMFPDGNRPYGDRFTANLPAECFKQFTAPLPWKFPGHEIL